MRTAHICTVLLGMALAGCGIAKRMEAQEQAKQLAAQSDAALADCNAKIPASNPKTVVARVKCLNDAMAIRMPLFGTDQDLALAYMAENDGCGEDRERKDDDGRRQRRRSGKVVAGLSLIHISEPTRPY